MGGWPKTLKHIQTGEWLEPTWYGMGVLDSTVNRTAPQWQLPLSSIGIAVTTMGGWCELKVVVSVMVMVKLKWSLSFIVFDCMLISLLSTTVY